jgi:hypothetical protein
VVGQQRLKAIPPEGISFGTINVKGADIMLIEVLRKTIVKNVVSKQSILRS